MISCLLILCTALLFGQLEGNAYLIHFLVFSPCNYYCNYPIFNNYIIITYCTVASDLAGPLLIVLLWSASLAIFTAPSFLLPFSYLPASLPSSPPFLPPFLPHLPHLPYLPPSGETVPELYRPRGAFGANFS